MGSLVDRRSNTAAVHYERQTPFIILIILFMIFRRAQEGTRHSEEKKDRYIDCQRALLFNETRSVMNGFYEACRREKIRDRRERKKERERCPKRIPITTQC